VEFFRDTNIDFLGKKWYFLTFSLIFSVAGVLSMAFWSSWAGPGRLSRRTTNVGPTGDTSTSTVEQR